MNTPPLSHEFDGISSRTVFCLWTGPEVMSANRIQALWSIFNQVACPVALVNQHCVEDWVKKDYPLHPAYPYLSSTHKSDYLRCYLMHHYGGGYTDIKITTTKWPRFFETLEHSGKLALGYTELAHGLPHVQGEFGDLLRRSHHELIGLCAFIFEKQSPLTEKWLNQVHDVLDRKLDDLQRFPASHPQDQAGVILPDGTKSSYPLRWAEILGEILHPLMYEYRAELMHAPIAPYFGSYR
ncbi:glycosyltransferase family 32 protein [Paraburkholderia caballeronis]|uniref:Glycosyltransferase sugar-binding region containing DXD motif-containing protein n=1 Tax=Paraburkholderia caballeronis TaxID=416943 RepID=A0A1H7SPY4_9BURK|nr:glycosyltransferase [Paraburkholderia caballeronis]PXW22421.1 glycosyl transferase-like sugar-binding protein [Paraburkholderia caballeronis]PXW96079.1 glycosyl transferase-like sugar-binding protein [Paraburkholderia caballeronis]RAJ92445.1 glycosyl transferase-like sugar-binding protein [Paraburkholderia caballeronis]SEB48974.1 Glycosyltransferase sugar-binding region containing DXD motif-containing protein [Paraburkholderia caballeronis]SEL74518.1 Glycosyltransferase sugar-binding region